MPQVQVHPCLALFEREIARFRSHARKRAGTDGPSRRRRSRRYHRSWPLMVAILEGPTLHEWSAALHDASQDGLGFMCNRLFEKQELVFVKLFWHEATALYIPAFVRHVNPGPSGVLVGVEFALSNLEACEKAFTIEEARNL